MRRTLWILVGLAGCGDDAATPVQDAPPEQIDAPGQGQCQPLGAVGAFYRRQPNPKLIAGTHTFGDSKLDTAITDPDLLWDGALWHLYFQSPHGSFASPGPMVIRHATSADLATWTFDDAPSLTLSASGWDSMRTEAPSVVYNPNAPADRKFLMVYSGAAQPFPHPGYSFSDYAIGAAISADGHTFTRVGTDGKVLDASQVYPGSPDGIVADPEIVLVGSTYHLWFRSFGCSGTSCGTTDAYGIAHATSTDGIAWTVQEAPVRSLLKVSSMLTTGFGQSSVVYDEPHCRFELWMADQADTSTQPVKLDNMSGVFHATSSNGTSWTPDFGLRDLSWDQTAAGEHRGLRTGADIAQSGTGRYMVYVGFDDQNVPGGSTLPTSGAAVAGVMTLNLATRDAAP